ncbi:DUF3667 domain-containing protein [Rubrivirga sp. S365]|uniref:DUF3667 domain-containing protein n=1 Tax=Rubrivirga litoralis TaxID=3075598 RepID=A0ABU3BT48_9BACT|nr:MULTISPECIES: DUF3667 domain-containing protein [unclassified Rubrivirga]MDT0632476.1 DUF3667 domain-containing protein [Rubrivirga sp. F394]MDT7857976.1 DUF3667 domain-containing protein [Rubrivirga sp. S365]
MPDVLTEAAALGLATDPEPRAFGPRPAPALCPNCGEARAGRFCAGCGQRELGGRLTLRGLWREFSSRVFNLDRGLLHTVTSLARSPGSVPRDYVEGRRRTYTNPLSFFLLATALSLLMYGLYDDALLDVSASSSFAQGYSDGHTAAGAPEDITPPREPGHEMTPEEAEREARFDAAYEELFDDGGQTAVRVMYEGMVRFNTPLTFLLALFLVPPLRLLFGSERNVAEVSVFALYAVGAVIAPFFVLGLGAVGSILWTFVAAGIYVLLVAWAAISFYPTAPPLGSFFRGGVAMTVAYGAYFVAVLLFGALYFATHFVHTAGETWGSLLGSIFS